jgi:hypothetical protein
VGPLSASFQPRISTITEWVTRGYLSMLMSGAVRNRDPVNYPPAGRVNV